MRIAGSSVSSIGTSAGSAASWTTTRPWNRRANSGVTSAVTSRWLARRASPHATRSVWPRVGIPSVSSACDTAAITRGRGSPAGLWSGSAGDWTTIVACAAPRASTSSEAPASGKRSASSVAASASVPRPGGGGRSTSASSAAPATTSREPERRGRVARLGILRASTDCVRRVESRQDAQMVDEERPRRGDPAAGLPSAFGVALAIAAGAVAYAAGHYTNRVHDAHRDGGRAGRAPSSRRASLRTSWPAPTHSSSSRARVPRDAGPGRRRPGRAGAEHDQDDPHRGAAHADHRPRTRRGRPIRSSPTCRSGARSSRRRRCTTSSRTSAQDFRTTPTPCRR